MSETVKQSRKAEIGPSQWSVDTALSVIDALKHRMLEDNPNLAENDPELHAALFADEGGADARIVLERLMMAAELNKRLAESTDKWIDDLETRKKRYIARMNNLKGAIFAIMSEVGIARHNAGPVTAGIRSAKASVIMLCDDLDVPEEYIRIQRSVDKAKIADDLANGVVLENIATMSNGSPYLVIQSK